MKRGDVLLALRSLVAAAALPGTITILVPRLLLGRGERFALGPIRFLFIVPLVCAAAGLVWCIVDFARLGRGTLAPLDPPRFVVRGGLYRWVRNPMYVCVAAILLSEALLFESRPLLSWTIVVALGFHIFVVLYEEPHLRRTFGADYEAYTRAVRRWTPRRPRSG